MIGIKWTNGLSWEQVKQKARRENKYIFLDCYATWCGPCKKMEKTVFTKKAVGELFNDHFISVRVQMDQSKMDNEYIKGWYKDASDIYKKYKINVFPSFLFFKPDGAIVHKDRGYKGAIKIIEIARLAITPGRKYEDPYKEYDQFVEAYKRKKIDYKRMPIMIEKAKELLDMNLASSLCKDYFGYLTQGKKDNWYSETNIRFIASNLKDSKSPFFKMFYPDGNKIERILGESQFARYTVDRILFSEIVKPYLDSFYSKHSRSDIASKIEPSWDSLRRAIAGNYNDDFAARAIRHGQSEFYWVTQNNLAYVKILIEMIKNNDMDPNSEESDLNINQASWGIFQESGDKGEIEMAIRWMQELILRDNVYNRKGTQFFIWDTYANLLYKSTVLFQTYQLSDAINWEEKALLKSVERDAPEDMSRHYRKTIDKMNKQIPTWN
jgi:thioredoxin-related protein